jgi:hypothetical protein
MKDALNSFMCRAPSKVQSWFGMIDDDRGRNQSQESLCGDHLIELISDVRRGEIVVDDERTRRREALTGPPQPRGNTSPRSEPVRSPQRWRMRSFVSSSASASQLTSRLIPAVAASSHRATRVPSLPTLHRAVPRAVTLRRGKQRRYPQTEVHEMPGRRRPAMAPVYGREG